MTIKEEYLFSKFYTPVKENNGKILTIGINPNDLQKLKPREHYIIKFYKLKIEE